ncbi:hypothetical protein DPMN_177570 [Dreissena polymorpha]|uniref:Uncharacterized protein n=1 Tax=Dreissena polymorpha TaxID=45954 RepID=A0A9D4E904_DREPO|nr:hypothetical protein DPMN_177570 [Dreissena polymorpha]
MVTQVDIGGNLHGVFIVWSVLLVCCTHHTSCSTMETSESSGMKGYIEEKKGMQ